MIGRFTHEEMRIFCILSIILGVVVLVYGKMKKQNMESDLSELDISGNEGIVLIIVSIIALVFSFITTYIPQKVDADGHTYILAEEEPPKTTEINGHTYYLYEEEE